MDDLVTRLRIEARRDPEIQHSGHSILSDAADEIARLQTAVRQQTEMADLRSREKGELRAENAKLQAALAAERERCATIADRFKADGEGVNLPSHDAWRRGQHSAAINIAMAIRRTSPAEQKGDENG